MSRLYVGKYQLGSDHVKVFLRSGDGGDGYILPWLKWKREKRK